MADLDERTEGWIAALQLAALSMQGRDDITGFIAGFAGDDRYIVDYLAEEVLQRQPADVRDFLLHTSVTSGAFPRNHQSDSVLISHSWRSGGTTHERHRSH